MGVDAGGDSVGGADVAPGDDSPDVAPAMGAADVAPDGSSADLAVGGAVDSSPALGIPHGFRIVNAMASTIYIDRIDPVKCHAQDTSGWQACKFSSMGCLQSCKQYQPGDQCCVFCEQDEQEVPSLLAVPAGENRTIAWGGSLFVVPANYCSECMCQDEIAVQQGTYEVTVSAYSEYACTWGQPCPEQPGGVFDYAVPQGDAEEHVMQFAIPSADDVVVITIPEELSVEQVLAGADMLLGAQLIVVGKVFLDWRQKPGDWPDPALSVFILQDGGDLPGYVAGAPTPDIQLYSTSDLSAYLEQQVRVTAYLRSVDVQYPNGVSAPFLYLEVISIAAL